MLDKIKQKLSPEKIALEKATLVFDNAGTKGTITCQFNPASLSISKSVVWKSVTPTGGDEKAETQPDQNAPDLIFAGGSSATFGMDLVFDTTILDNQDVRGFTNQLLQLTLMGGGQPGKKDEDPPVVTFIWGEFELFDAVIKGVQINYTLFLPSGIPVRARAHVDFIQAFDSDGDLPAQNPTSRTDPRKIHMVSEGDRLDYLAYREYGRADHWRQIAEVNQLEDPLKLKVGQFLILPPIG